MATAAMVAVMDVIGELGSSVCEVCSGVCNGKGEGLSVRDEGGMSVERPISVMSAGRSQ